MKSIAILCQDIEALKASGLYPHGIKETSQGVGVLFVVEDFAEIVSAASVDPPTPIKAKAENGAKGAAKTWEDQRNIKARQQRLEVPAGSREWTCPHNHRVSLGGCRDMGDRLRVYCDECDRPYIISKNQEAA